MLSPLLQSVFKSWNDKCRNFWRKYYLAFFSLTFYKAIAHRPCSKKKWKQKHKHNVIVTLKITQPLVNLHSISIPIIIKSILGFMYSKGGFKSEDTWEFLLLQKNIPNHYPQQKISFLLFWADIFCSVIVLSDSVLEK